MSTACTQQKRLDEGEAGAYGACPILFGGVSRGTGKHELPAAEGSIPGVLILDAFLLVGFEYLRCAHAGTVEEMAQIYIYMEITDKILLCTEPLYNV